MAVYYEQIAATPSVFARLAEKAQAYRATLSHHLAQRAEANRVFAELNALTDAELSDIGISRHAIADIAREAGRMI